MEPSDPGTVSSDETFQPEQRSNDATGQAATVPGGSNNRAEGEYSLAAGRLAGAIHDGAFVVGDSTLHDVESASADEVRFQAGGGFVIEHLNASNEARPRAGTHGQRRASRRSAIRSIGRLSRPRTPAAARPGRRTGGEERGVARASCRARRARRSGIGRCRRRTRRRRGRCVKRNRAATAAPGICARRWSDSFYGRSVSIGS